MGIYTVHIWHNGDLDIRQDQPGDMTEYDISTEVYESTNKPDVTEATPEEIQTRLLEGLCGSLASLAQSAERIVHELRSANRMTAGV